MSRAYIHQFNDLVDIFYSFVSQNYPDDSIALENPGRLIRLFNIELLKVITHFKDSQSDENSYKEDFNIYNSEIDGFLLDSIVDLKLRFELVSQFLEIGYFFLADTSGGVVFIVE